MPPIAPQFSVVAWDDGSTWVFLGRLALAMVCGSVIGLERERSGKPAGVRTTILICMGACLYAEASLLTAQIGAELSTDPSRVAAQIVSGIGFLGAGTIFRAGNHVQGLTTAATIWFVAALGMLVGFGYPLLAIVSALVGLFVLTGLGALDRFGSTGSGPRSSRRQA